MKVINFVRAGEVGKGTQVGLFLKDWKMQVDDLQQLKFPPEFAITNQRPA